MLQNQQLTQTNRQSLGFRQVEVRGNELLVNGRPVKLHGVCRHSIDPLTGRTVSPEEDVHDAEIFRAGNVNWIRTSHYPPSEEFLDACDRLGIFVEAEAAICWVNHGASPIWKKWSYLDPKFLPYFVRANYDNVVANRHHPCIIVWSLANESFWSPLFARTHELVRQLDPSRPTTFQDQCWGGYNNAGSRAEIAIYHYPGFNGPATPDTYGRPVLFDEYSHVECYNRREWFTDPGIRAMWGPPLEHMVDLMWENQGCLGGAIWAGIDDLFDLPDGKIVGYGTWGVIDGWRREKPEYFGMKKAYTSVRVFDADKPLQVANGELHIKVQNRYDFTNLSNVKIAWRLGSETGTATADIAPHAEGEIVIAPKTASAHGEPLEITFTDPRGFVCEQDKIAVSGGAPSPKIPAQKVNVNLNETADAFLIKLGEASYEIDKQSGRIIHATENGRAIAVSGPDLMLLSLNESGGESGPAGSLFVNHLDPFTPVCAHWKAASVKAARAANGEVVVHVEGAYDEAAGNYTLHFSTDGLLRVDYQFATKQDVNPRQWGVVFETPRDFDTLSWNRRSHWTDYPADDIARPVGEAKANAQNIDYVMQPRERPAASWSQDTSPLGSNDFRSTKENVFSAALKAANGDLFAVKSDGSQSIRAWVDGSQIKLLVAGFNTGGAEGFDGAFFADTRHPLKKSDTIKSSFQIGLQTR